MAVFDARPSAFTQMTTTAEWEYLWSAAGGLDGVDLTYGGGLAPSLDSGGRNAVMASGNAVIKGQLWRCDAAVNTAIPAASAQNRIDRLVLRLTRGAVTSPTVVQPVVITGTPSGTPTEPPLVRTTSGIYDLPISSWTSTSAGAITSLVDERQLTFDTWHDMRPLQSLFVGTIAGELPPQYRLDPTNGIVWVTGTVQLPPSGSYNGNTIFTFPSLYCPPVQVSWPIVPLFGSPSGNTNTGERAYVSPAGSFQVNGVQSAQNGQNLRIHGSYAVLDNGLITS